MTVDLPTSLLPPKMQRLLLNVTQASLVKVSRDRMYNACWMRAGAFELWTLCPTDFDFPKEGFR